jgi:hypothetical protein
VTRFKQVQEAQSFIAEKVTSSSFRPGDLVILCGDLNINGATPSEPQKEMLAAVKETNR